MPRARSCASSRSRRAGSKTCCAAIGSSPRRRWRCPLTLVAERYTTDRSANFDIFLPERLARWNKEIFGTLFLVGVVTLVLRWRGAM